MIVAGSLALLTVSAVVAFQGWPGLDSSRASSNAGALLTAQATPRAAPDRVTRALVVPHRAAMSHAAKVQHKAVAPKATTVSVQPGAHTATKVHTRPATPPPAVTAVEAATVKAPAPKRQASPGDPVRKVGTSLGDTVKGAGQHLDGLVVKISPGVGNVVEQVTNLVAGVVAGASNVVGKVLDTLAHPPQR